MNSESETPATPQKNATFIMEQEKARWREQSLKDYHQQLANDPRFIEYAKDFRADSVVSFIEDFACRKVRWLEWGEKYGEWNEGDEVAWQDEALPVMKEIQQKKLFDLQCQWRAEKITLPGVQICFDFILHSHHILNCPFLEPVHEEEVELYLRYLQSNNYQFMSGFYDWQRYEEIRSAYENDNDSRIPFPEWYAFYDSNRGTGIYLTLPDVRGERERFYISLTKQNAHPKPAATLMAPTAKQKPPLNYWKNGFMDWFVKTFDTPQTNTYYHAIRHTINDLPDENLQAAIEMLSKAKQVMPMKKSPHWQEAVYKAAGAYKKIKIAQALPAAYEAYRMKSDNHIPFEEAPDIVALFDSMKRTSILKEILEGRVLNGEAGDLKF